MPSVNCVLLDGTRPSETEASVCEVSPYKTPDGETTANVELMWRGASYRLTCAAHGAGLFQAPWRPDAQILPILLPWPFTIVGVVAPCLLAYLDASGRPQSWSCRNMLAWLRGLPSPDFLPPMRHDHTDEAHKHAIELLAAYKGSEKGPKKSAGASRRTPKAKGTPRSPTKGRRISKKAAALAASTAQDLDVPESPASRADSDESEAESVLEPDGEAEPDGLDLDDPADSDDVADDEDAEIEPEADEDEEDEERDEDEIDDDALGSEMDDDLDGGSDGASDVCDAMSEDDEDALPSVRPTKPRARSQPKAKAKPGAAAKKKK